MLLSENIQRDVPGGAAGEIFNILALYPVDFAMENSISVPQNLKNFRLRRLQKKQQNLPNLPNQPKMGFQKNHQKHLLVKIPPLFRSF